MISTDRPQRTNGNKFTYRFVNVEQIACDDVRTGGHFKPHPSQCSEPAPPLPTERRRKSVVNNWNSAISFVQLSSCSEHNIRMFDIFTKLKLS